MSQELHVTLFTSNVDRWPIATERLVYLTGLPIDHGMTIHSPDSISHMYMYFPNYTTEWWLDITKFWR